MYDYKLVEKKWQKYWKENHTFKFVDDCSSSKMYVLDMFPYPSAKGLHVGHPKGYVATDVLSRYYRLKGYNVLHPIGWDAFGLPAEQFALDSGQHPGVFTFENIDRFRNQLISFGFSFDYDKEVNTTDPKYYKWTQWIFVQLYKNGLAELRDIDVNWCDGLGCVLSNEEVIVDKEGRCVSERGKFPVVKRPMRQWVLKITKYADKLIEGLNEIDWPESLKAMQRNWIGRSEGLVIKFPTTVDGEIEIFTTRPDTIFGTTFVALSPKHPQLASYVNEVNKVKVHQFLAEYTAKNDLIRQQKKEWSGVFTGSYAINPFTKELLPIWVTDYVLADFGTGAVMATPAHDERDFAFAKRYHLPIKFVIKTELTDKPYDGDGIHINSSFLNGLDNQSAISVITEKVLYAKIGRKHVAYKLRDWVFSRQRYWGEPFPILFDDENHIKVIEDLPVVLPETNDIKPSGTGESPLANLKDWVNVTIDGKHYRRETNTMPQWAGSCWYYLGYLMKEANGEYLPMNSKEAKKRFQRWLPVDVYVGGQEHAVLHLLYARFWHRFLYDIGVVTTKEPFYKIINQGMILGPDGVKMSKSRKNVINPDDIITSHGADALRLYEAFMGPLTASLPWQSTGLDGVYRWLCRVYRLFQEHRNKFTNDHKLVSNNFKSEYNKLIREFSTNIEKERFNLGVSNMMIFINVCYSEEHLLKECMDGFLILLSCYAPHLAEELYSFDHNESVCLQKLPKIISNEVVVDSWTIPVQINGKLRATIKTNSLSQDAVLKKAKDDETIRKWLTGKKIVKEIYVKGKILNFIVK